MRKVYNWRVVEGDPNEVKEGEILIVRDKDNPNRLDSYTTKNRRAIG